VSGRKAPRRGNHRQQRKQQPHQVRPAVAEENSSLGEIDQQEARDARRQHARNPERPFRPSITSIASATHADIPLRFKLVQSLAPRA
jgi:hypothetical protein